MEIETGELSQLTLIQFFLEPRSQIIEGSQLNVSRNLLLQIVMEASQLCHFFTCFFFIFVYLILNLCTFYIFTYFYLSIFVRQTYDDCRCSRKREVFHPGRNIR